MKLYGSRTSPYVRKIRLLIAAGGGDTQVRFVETDPWTNEELRALNPLCKVPTLDTGADGVLIESKFIAEYLDATLFDHRFLPRLGSARWRVLRLQALGDAIADAAVIRRLEQLRPENLRSASVDQRQRLAIAATLDHLEQDVGTVAGDGPTLGTFALLAALGYLDFRFADEDWRGAHPRLADWFEGAVRSDGFRATEPPR